MAFSEETMGCCEDLAERAKASYPFGAIPKGFDFTILFPLILGLIQNFCKPKTEEARAKLVAQTAAKVAANGVKGCIDCLPKKAAEKLRRKMARRTKVKNADAQDKLFYAAVMTANADREPTLKGMGDAYETGGSDDEDD